MSSGVGGLKLHCEHVSKRHVHCNKYTVLDIGLYQTPLDAIQESHWTIEDGNILCEEHT